MIALTFIILLLYGRSWCNVFSTEYPKYNNIQKRTKKKLDVTNKNTHDTWNRERGKKDAKRKRKQNKKRTENTHGDAWCMVHGVKQALKKLTDDMVSMYRYSSFSPLSFRCCCIAYQDGFGTLGVVKDEILPLTVVVCGEEGVDHESADQGTAHIVL